MPDMNNYPVWPGWESVRLIGRGSYGSVYEIQRDIFDETEKAAMKVISIPQSEGDVEELIDSGYSRQNITETFKEHLQGILREYSLMRQMNGSANVVNCDDVRIVQHDDGIGWDIFIRMELLTPLNKALEPAYSEEQALRIGRDMCKALILCQKHDIIHRDIKPQNIFLSPNGDYKLGDFGIAKTVEKTSGGTKIGTYKYMAPEVYHSRPYNRTVDIYSLGLVLYWLLNERRSPFAALPPAPVSAKAEEAARARRFRGEALPAPVHGSEALQRIVLKACAYDPGDRYQTPEEMLSDLNGIGRAAGTKAGGAGKRDTAAGENAGVGVGGYVRRGPEIIGARERGRRDTESARDLERERREAEAARARERERREAEAAQARERERREAEAAQARERERREAEAAQARERERREAESARDRAQAQQATAEAPPPRKKSRLWVIALAAAAALGLVFFLGGKGDRSETAKTEEATKQTAAEKAPAGRWVIVNSFYYYKGELTSQNSWTYEEDGSYTLNYTYYSSYNGKVSRTRTVYERNAAGKIVKVTDYDGDTGELQSYTEYIYGEDGRLRQINTYAPDGTLTESHNEPLPGERLAFTYRYENGKAQLQDRYEYDEDGRMIKDSYYSSSDGSLSLMWEYTYDENGRRLTSVFSNYYSGALSSRSVTTYEYDSDGRMQRSKEVDSETGETTIGTYTYDKYGNQLLYVTVRNGEEISRSVYEYAYMENGVLTGAVSKLDSAGLPAASGQ